MQVKLFVHVMAQVYNKDQWTNAIMRVSARVSLVVTYQHTCDLTIIGLASEILRWDSI